MRVYFCWQQERALSSCFDRVFRAEAVEISARHALDLDDCAALWLMGRFAAHAGASA